MSESWFIEDNEDTVRIELLLGEYEKIKNRLEELLNTGKITEYMKCTITDMAGKVLEHIAEKYKNVREGVKSVMGGKVLEYEVKTGVRPDKIVKPSELDASIGESVSIILMKALSKDPKQRFQTAGILLIFLNRK